MIIKKGKTLIVIFLVIIAGGLVNVFAEENAAVGSNIEGRVPPKTDVGEVSPKEEPPAEAALQRKATEAAAVEEKAAGEKPAEEKLIGEKIKPDSITIDFKDADIKTVLRVLAEKSGINIVSGKDVEGFVTIRLSNVNWEVALDIICKNYGFAYERDENIIRVTTLENLKQEELTTEVFTLNYAKAKEIAEAIKEMLTDRGKDKIKFDERTNVLIVTDIPTNLYKIRQVIAKLDAKTPQVLIEAKIIETTLDDDEKLGIDWSVKFSVAGAKRPWVFPFETVGSKLAGIKMGDLWPVGKGAQTAAGGTTTTVPSDDFHDTSLSSMPLAVTSNFTMGTLDFSQFSAILEYLDSRTNTEVISNPRIATLNNKPALIHVGEELNFPNFERNPDTGTMEMTGFYTKDVGIILNVTPSINDRGDIVVDVKPEVSAFLAFETLDESRQIKAPKFSIRKAQTQTMVQDGETIMIGGLISENKQQYEKKIPFLGDLPAIGKLWFTKTEQAKGKTELIIFMTVRLIQDNKKDASLASAAFVPIAGENENTKEKEKGKK